jgi:hypothetical protein
MSGETRSVGLDIFNEIEAEKKITGKKHLLVIAIDDYHPDCKKFHSLKYPVQDANNLTNLLVRSFGFEADVTTVFDAACTDDNIKVAIRKTKEKLKPEDHLVVFFAGHGAVDDGNGYWIVYKESDSVDLHMPVSDVVQRLLGSCRQVLMIVDCCFGGVATKTAYCQALTTQLDKNSSQLAVITSGNIKETVPDKSEFMLALLSLLSNTPFDNLQSFIGAIKSRFDGDARTTITDFVSPDQHKLPFIFENKNKAWIELESKLLELNFNKQSVGTRGLNPFNLLYLRGTKKCGHHLFTYRFLKNNGVTKDDLSFFKPNYISFGGEANGRDYDIWKKIARAFGWGDAGPENIIDVIFKKLETDHWILVVKVDGNCDNKSLQDTLYEFWVKVNDHLTCCSFDYNKNRNKIHFLIWDRRGDSLDIIEDKWKKDFNEDLAKLLHLPPIEFISKQSELRGWYNDTRDNTQALKKEKIFLNLQIQDIAIPNPIEDVICSIVTKCEQEQIHDKFFNQQNFLMQ